MRIRPDEVRAIVCTATAFYDNNQFSEALKLFEKAMMIDEKTPDVVYNYANCLFNLNREEEAIKYY